MAGLPREIIRWLQSLDLSFQVKNPKWDFSNGYLIAEIFSWYFPHEISMPSFNTGHSTEMKLRNWFLLKNFIKRNSLPILEEHIEATIHSKDGAAQILIKGIFESLTNRRLRVPAVDTDGDFNDLYKQAQWPQHARPTASKTIKNNLAISEMIAHPSLVLNQQKAQHLIGLHLDQRRLDRHENAKRYEVHETIGQQCIREPPRKAFSFTYGNTWTSANTREPTSEDLQVSQPVGQSQHTAVQQSVQTTEIQVRQMQKYKNPIPTAVG